MTWIMGLIAAAGGAGGIIVALAPMLPVLAPAAGVIRAAMGAAWAVVKTVCGWAWRATANPPGSRIAVLVAALAAGCLCWWGSDGRGYDRGHATCEAAHKAAVAALAQRQTAAVTAAYASSEARTEAHRQIDATNKETIRYVVQTVAARPDAHDVCVDADVADRVRRLK